LPVINAFSGAFSLDGGGLGAIIKNLGNTIVNVFTPIINGMVNAFGYVKDAIGDNLETFKTFGSYIATYLAPVIGTILGGALQIAGKIAGTVIDVIGDVVKILNGLISGAIAGINALITAYNFANNIFGGKDIPKISAPSINIPKTSTSAASTAIPTLPKISVPSTSTGAGGGGVATAAKAAASTTAKITGLSTSAVSGLAKTAAGASGTTINVNVSGAVDKEGTARTIVDTLNNSYYRGTGGAGNLVA
jgi:phage-related protein